MNVLRGFSAFLLCVCTAAAWAGEPVWLLDADLWARPRDGAGVVRMAPLVEALEAWMAHPRQRLMVRYPGGEEGLLWANELKSWLVALGLPSQRLELVAGSRRPDRIELELKR